MAGVYDVLGLVGARVDGKYLVESAVGQGGFAVVYRARDEKFREPVALKFLKLQADPDDEVYRRTIEGLDKEALLLRKLGGLHPSVVKVLGYGLHRLSPREEAPYLVLEWLDGKPLDAVLLDRAGRGEPPLGEQEAIALLWPAVEALAAAHRGVDMGAGPVPVAHRDVKPSNLFVVPGPGGQRTLKLLDFGIAKVMEAQAAHARAATTGSFHPFTPRYGAPEQFVSDRWGPTGPWTDVFALALVLVELVSGRPALDGVSSSELFLSAVASRRPTPRERGATVSDDVERLCAWALSVEPGQRPADAGALLEALRKLRAREPLADTTVVEAPAAPAKRRASASLAARASLAVGGLLVALGGAALAKRAMGRAAIAAPQVSPARGGEMVFFAGGAFTMQQKNGSDDGGPTHVVRLNDFWLDRTEVTVDAFRECVQAGACRDHEDSSKVGCNSGKPDRGNHPINCVNAAQAEEFCRWAGKRLPREEEWEHAARGREPRVYPWGNEPPSGANQVCWGGAAAGTHHSCAVGASPLDRTGEGVVDLAGNVNEWVADPECPPSGPCSSDFRLIKGGCWFTVHETKLHSSKRVSLAADARLEGTGFRCAR